VVAGVSGPIGAIGAGRRPRQNRHDRRVHLDVWHTGVTAPATPAERALRASGIPRLDFDRVRRMPVHDLNRRMRAAGYYPQYLTSENYKLDKAVAGEAIEITGIALLPHAMSGVGRTFCAYSVPSCRATCLAIGAGWNAARPEATIRPRLARSIALGADPEAFAAMLLHQTELWSCRLRSQGVTPALRLNIYSDIPWELVSSRLVWRLGRLARLYDYTKVPGRRRAAAALGYDLTFSWSGPRSAADARRELDGGGRVAIVFQTPGRPSRSWHAPLPRSIDGYPVVDGDVHDARFLDPAGVIVGLRFKQMDQRDARAAAASDFVVAGPWSRPGYVPAAERGLLATRRTA
jgi:hypothetical protein